MNLKCTNLIAYPLLLFLCFPIGTAGQDKTQDGKFSFHSVRNNETVFSIAKENGVTPEDIYRYNPKSRENIRPGDVLQIPKPDNLLNGRSKEQKEDQAFTLHKVRRKETLYFISQKYKCTPEEILKLNPGITGSIKKGTVLKVPNPDYLPQSAKATATPDKFFEYRVVSGDNYFQMKKRFGIDREELIELNPTLKNGFNAGMVIRIPAINTQPQREAKEENLPVADKETNVGEGIPLDANRTYNIAFYLPFCGSLNDSANLSPKTTNYLEFYEGAMLAVDKMTSVGMKLKLYVYDTYQDPKIAEQLVKKPEFLSLDLIIGPVYPECQKIITELSAKNHIPMVSPLVSDSRFVSGNPYYFQINPDRNFRLTGTADYIISEYSKQNVIVLNRGNNNYDQKILIDRLKGKINAKGFHIYNLWSDGIEGLESLLKPEDENIVVMTDDDEANISVAITRLNTVSKKFKITLIGLQEYSRLQSINIEYLHDLKLHYLAPYFIDYNDPQVTGFIDKYRLNFSAEPTQFSFQGYDVTINFLTDLRLFGKKFVSMNPIPKTNLLQAEYNFQKVTNFGGYVNHTFFVIEYSDNYEVKSTGKINSAF
jgi:LysM repeat protein/ABC-type branched-subunit amino acid transport system substrate-binding protein